MKDWEVFLVSPKQVYFFLPAVLLVHAIMVRVLYLGLPPLTVSSSSPQSYLRSLSSSQNAGVSWSSFYLKLYEGFSDP